MCYDQLHVGCHWWEALQEAQAEFMTCNTTVMLPMLALSTNSYRNTREEMPFMVDT